MTPAGIRGGMESGADAAASFDPLRPLLTRVAYRMLGSVADAEDVVNTAIYPQYNKNLALSISGQKIPLDAADRVLFLDFGKKIGLPDKAIKQIFADLKQQVRKAASIIRPPDADDPDSFMHRFEEIVRNACLRILED